MKQPIMLQSNQNQAGVGRNSVCYTLTASMGLGGGYVPMIVVTRRFSNVNVADTEVSPCLEEGSGKGGNNLPMIIEETDNGTDAT